MTNPSPTPPEDRDRERAKAVWKNVHAAYWDHIPDSVEDVIAAALRAEREATLEEAAAHFDKFAGMYASWTKEEPDNDGWLEMCVEAKNIAKAIRSLKSPAGTEKEKANG